jgi:hypothetical protein
MTSKPLLYVKGIWERGTFTVPENTPEDRIQSKSAEYKKTFGKILESQGFIVLEMTSPTLSNGVFKTDPDMKRYEFYARVIRKPQTVRISVPDIAVPALLEKGLRLLD